MAHVILGCVSILRPRKGIGKALGQSDTCSAETVNSMALPMSEVGVKRFVEMTLTQLHVPCYLHCWIHWGHAFSSPSGSIE